MKQRLIKSYLVKDENVEALLLISLMSKEGFWMGVFSFLTSIGILSGLCLITGLALVIFEMFHPGFGAPGIVGGILLLLGIILTAKTVIQVLILLVIILAILGGMLTVVLHSATKGYMAKNLVLTESLEKDLKAFKGEDLNFFLGKVGTTTTVLRPAGVADFDGVRLDVVSEGEFIPQGTEVQIISIEGIRIVVKANV